MPKCFSNCPECQPAERAERDVLEIPDRRGDEIKRAGGKRRQNSVHPMNKTEMRGEGKWIQQRIPISLSELVVTRSKSLPSIKV
jgi:hypothetical protein